LDVLFRDDFEKSSNDTFKITNHDISVEPITKIEIVREVGGIGSGWFCDCIEVEDERLRKVYIFPVHRWLPGGESFFIQHLDAILPQFDKHREQRDKELEEKKRKYEYEEKMPGIGVVQVCKKDVFGWPKNDNSTLRF
jgi:hypothetical protein